MMLTNKLKIENILMRFPMIKTALLMSLLSLSTVKSVYAKNETENITNKNTDTQLSQAKLDKLIAPNILFIYTDDQAPWAIGKSGNEQALTPNLDKLATQGMYFPNAYSTTPVCSPSRAGLLTSQYGYELGIDDWIKNNKAKSLTGNQPDLGIDASYETWPEILQNAGYYTGLIGKWHVGEEKQHHPTNHGYDEFIGFTTGGKPAINPQLEKNGELTSYQGLTTDILTDEAIEFITKNTANKFVLSLHYRAPHHPFFPVAAEDFAPYENMEIKLPHPNYPDLDTVKAKQLMREYLSSVRGVDRNVGRLLAELDKLGLANNTLVVFTSDHGYNIGHNGIWHKGNGFWLLNEKVSGIKNIPANQRPNMYDTSIKVPTVIRWPDVIPANSTNNTTLSNLDWFPTFVELAKTKAKTENIVRGKSVVPALLNENVVLSTDYYGAYSTLHQSLTHMRMYSDGKYKLIKDFLNKDNDEFYDLTNDPQETKNLMHNNLSAKQQQIIKRFEEIITHKMKATNDPILQPILQIEGK